MKNTTKAALILILISPFVELFGNTRPFVYFHPIIFVAFLLVYGIPVLIIRELSLRWKLGLPGILILGIAYGIFNEGVAAKTLLMSKNVPINTFDNYGIFLGINFSWFPFITIFHALHSVLFPILIVYFFFPEVIDKSWISMKKMWFFGGLSLVMGTLMFLNKDTFRALPIYIGVFIVMIFILALSSYLFSFCRKKKVTLGGDFSMWPILLGVFTFGLYIVSFILSADKLYLPIFYLFFILSILFVSFLFSKKNLFGLNSLVLFAIGASIMNVGFGIYSYVIRGMLDGLAVNFLFIFILFWLLFKVKKSAKKLIS